MCSQTQYLGVTQQQTDAGVSYHYRPVPLGGSISNECFIPFVFFTIEICAISNLIRE